MLHLRALSILRLAPALAGGGVLAMIGTGPDEAELNFCKWIGKAATVQPACLHGLPSEVLWLGGIALVAGGVIWFLWPIREAVFGKIKRVEPIHLIALGLAIAVSGVIWHWRKAPPIDPQI